jgi:(E)-4-hydroxy-3-methylbut-2-enyl-diphosphate synthase
MVIQVSEFVASRALDWRVRFPGSENLVIAVMGCVVNGIKEAQHADIGISLPGRTGESPLPMVFSDGKSYGVLQEENPGKQFTQFLEDYIKSHFGSGVAE